ncbi:MULTISPECIES: hypothetical protein [Bacillus]|nr:MULTISPECIES: hypothetical protein [Bacillus]MEB9339022.1 hypothetical protein [Bacillus cereus]CCW04282.1 hypothetical protein EBGED10_9990 [Bacillus sp. GeD10]
MDSHLYFAWPIVCIKMDLKYLEKRLDTYKEMLDIQNEKIDDSWRYFNKR